MSWFAIALFCAFLLASADAFTKAKLASHAAAELTVIRFFFTGAVLSPLLFRVPFSELPWAFWFWVLIAVPIELLANVLYMSALRSAPLSQTLPYLAFTPVFVVATGHIIAGEHVSGLGLFGILLVVVGAFSLHVFGDAQSTTARGSAPWFSAVVRGLRQRSAQKMLGVAALYAITSAIGKHALSFIAGVNFAAVYYGLLGASALLLFSVLGWAKPSVVVRPPRASKLILALLMGSMILLHFFGLERVEVAYFIAAKRTSLLFGILYGAFVFGERRLIQNLWAGGTMALGAAVLALAA